MSSRNVRLSGSERRRATALHRALLAADAAVRGGERDAAEITARAHHVLASAEIDTEYFTLAEVDTFEPVEWVGGPVLALVAARVGSTRLIDNQLLFTAAKPAQPVAAGSVTTTNGRT
jgi:pantoate--beta-alanine ligase